MKERTSSKNNTKILDTTDGLMLDNAMLELLTSENPANLGVYKQNKKVFAYEIGKNDRLIFTLDYEHNKIIFHRVCDYKSVYNKD